MRLDRNLPSLEGGREISWTFQALPSPERIDREATFPVRRHDLDINRHANNAVFVQWAVDTVPAETAETFSPWKIEALFIAEAREGDQVISQIQNTDDGENPSFIHRIVRTASGKELAKVKTVWRKS